MSVAVSITENLHKRADAWNHGIDVTGTPLPPNQPGGMRVMSQYCAICVFTSRSHMRPGPLFDALRREWNAHDTHQTCMYTAVERDNIVCHGFFREVFLTTGLGQELRIAQQVAGFEYVDPPRE
ncbi:MAG: hypothetical protein EPO65_05280 [Dehalococcoidia bacterium]|nr:MAG: hypothetical protein EPO65_05280 [Dehalococcoidia bacterium]